MTNHDDYYGSKIEVQTRWNDGTRTLHLLSGWPEKTCIDYRALEETDPDRLSRDGDVVRIRLDDSWADYRVTEDDYWSHRLYVDRIAFGEPVAA